MGERGPKPLPPNVHLLRGNASHKPLASLLDDVVRPDVDIPECPDHLDGEARAEWDRITPHLFALGLISQIDRAALAAYCDVWGEYVAATRCVRVMMAHQHLPVPASLPEEVREWFAGRVATTPSGYQQISIPIQHRNKSLEQLKSFLAMFGLSPADRSRVTQSDPRGSGAQQGLPGIPAAPKVDGWEEFE